MNPYGEFGSAHSTCMFNLPPWLCLKRKFIMMPVIIEGPKEPGNDTDVFLQPLMDDLLLLWSRYLRKHIDLPISEIEPLSWVTDFPV